MKMVYSNCKYRSQQPNLNKLETRSPQDSPKQILMILRIGQKFQKITHKAMNNRGSTLILTDLVGVYPWNIHTNSVQWFEKSQKKFTTITTMTTTDTRWSLESHSLIECDEIWYYCSNQDLLILSERYLGIPLQILLYEANVNQITLPQVTSMIFNLTWWKLNYFIRLT